MNSLEIEQIILTHIATWQHFNPNRLAQDNRNIAPPKDGVWGRVSILGGINAITSLSDEPCVLQVGTLVIQLFCAENQGTVKIKTWADSLAEHLKAKQLERLELLAPSIINVPSNDGIYQINVSVPYRYY